MGSGDLTEARRRIDALIAQVTERHMMDRDSVVFVTFRCDCCGRHRDVRVADPVEVADWQLTAAGDLCDRCLSIGMKPRPTKRGYTEAIVRFDD